MTDCSSKSGEISEILSSMASFGRFLASIPSRCADKTEVNGSRPLAPIFPQKVNGSPEDLPVRELLAILLAPEGRRRVENKFKTNGQPLDVLLNKCREKICPNGIEK
jgi:hypothetical protein